MTTKIHKQWSPVRLSQTGNPDLLHFVRVRPRATPRELVEEAAEESIPIKVHQVHEMRRRIKRERAALGERLLAAVRTARPNPSGCIVVDELPPCTGSAARCMLEWRFGRPLNVLEGVWQTCGCSGCLNPAHIQWSLRRDDGRPGKIRTKRLQWAHQSLAQLDATLTAQVAELIAC